MTYETDRDALSRQPLNIVEVDFDTKITSGGKEYLCDGDIPFGQNMWPCVSDIRFVSTRASADGGLGYLGDVEIICKDFGWPNGNGTYFGRLLANNKYYLNRAVKIHVGFFRHGDTFSFANFQERRYFLKKIVGPDQNGNIKLFASDVLSQLKESQLPNASGGNLNASLTDSATGTINIQDNDGFSSGYAIIDDEIVAYSGTSGGDSIIITSRGQGGTTAESHDADSPVRHIFQYTGKSVDCIRHIIENYTDIDHASYINDTEWNTERDTYLQSEDVEVWITQPTDASKVIDDIGKQTYTNVWWNDSEQEIKIKAIGPTLSSTIEWNDNDNILNTKYSVKKDQKQILTAVWVYYGKIDQSGSNNSENYSNIHIHVDTAAETGLGTSKVKKIFASYIPSAGSATASKIASRLTSQNGNPIEITLQVDASDSDVEVGDPLDVNSDMLQGTDGMPAVTRMRIIEKSLASYNRYNYKMVFSGVEVSDRYAVIGPNSLLAYTSESTANQNTYGFICDTDNEMSNGDNPYLIL